MLKTIGKIIFSFLFLVSAWGKTPEENYKLVSPRFIPQNSIFEISLVTSNRFPSADKLELYIIPETGLNLNRVDLRTFTLNTKLNFGSSYLESLKQTALKTEINLEENSLYPRAFFQVVFTLRSDNSLNSSIKIYGLYKSKDRVIGYLSENHDNLILSQLKLFKPQKTSGRAVQLTNQSQLNFSLKDTKASNLLTELWIKPNDPAISILKISSVRNPDYKIELSTNEFQMLSVSADDNIEWQTPYFMSRKAWYHLSVLYSEEKKKIYFYCNGVLFARLPVNNLVAVNDLNISFFVSEPGKSFQIDLLRFIDFNNSIEVSFANRSFANFKADSSFVIAQYKFDSDESLENNHLLLTKENLQYVKSDAPVIARAPELNIMLLSNSYELEWSGGDYNQAASYVLEKSSGNSEYQPVIIIQADNSGEKTYSYVDEKDAVSEIVYYRVKQVNEDGSIVYSSQVKVGQGKMESFTMHQNYPNPFNPKTSINIELLEDSDVEVTIYNLEGQEIRKLYKGMLAKGLHTFEFDAKELPSGVYLYKVATPGFSQTRKMVLAK